MQHDTYAYEIQILVSTGITTIEQIYNFHGLPPRASNKCGKYNTIFTINTALTLQCTNICIIYHSGIINYTIINAKIYKLYTLRGTTFLSSDQHCILGRTICPLVSRSIQRMQSGTIQLDTVGRNTYGIHVVNICVTMISCVKPEM